MKEKGREKKSKEGFHDLRNRVEWEREGNDLFLPNKAGWAEDLQRTVVAELGAGRAAPVLNDLRVGSDHFFYLIETGLGQVFGFTGIGLQIIELNEDWIFQFLVVFGGSAKFDQGLLPGVLGFWFREEGAGTSASRSEDQFPIAFIVDVRPRAPGQQGDRVRGVPCFRDREEN